MLSHIRFYSATEQPDFIAAIMLCENSEQLELLVYYNLKSLYNWPAAHLQAIDRQKQFWQPSLGVGQEERYNTLACSARSEQAEEYHHYKTPSLA